MSKLTIVVNRRRRRENAAACTPWVCLEEWINTLADGAETKYFRSANLLLISSMG